MRSRKRRLAGASPESHARVLQVHHFRYPTIRGGVDRVVAELATALGPASCVLFEVGDWGERRLERRVESGLTIYRRHLKLPWATRGLPRKLYAVVEMLVVLLQLRRLLRRERVDVVHLHTLQDYHAYFRILGRLGIRPYLVTLHGSETLSYADRSSSQRKRWASILSNASTVVAVSRTLGDLATVNLPLMRTPRVVHNGIADPMVNSNKPRLGAGRAPYALCVGALEDYKGHAVAIDAWAVLRNQGIDLELLIAGDGRLRQELEARAANRGGADHIHFLGALPHHRVLELVSDAAVYVMPSRNEGLGVALLEAAALSRPIVASDIPVFREIIEDGRSGILFPVGDAQALAAGIQSVLVDTAKAQAIAQEARERFLTTFGRDRMAAAYQQIYDSALVPLDDVAGSEASE